MEIFGSLAATAQLADFCVASARKIITFYQDACKVDETVVRLRNDIGAFIAVTSNTSAMLNTLVANRSHRKTEAFEQSHWTNIKYLLDRCNVTLQGYALSIPDVQPGDRTPLARVQIQLAMDCKATTIGRLRADIALYTQMLQLYLQTLNFIESCKSRTAQDKWQVETSAKIHELENLLRHREDGVECTGAGHLAVQSACVSTYDPGLFSNLARDEDETGDFIREWREYVQTVGDEDSGSGQSTPQDGNGPAMSHADSGYDSESRYGPEPVVSLDPDYLLRFINDNAKGAKERMEAGQYQEAIELQLKAIRHATNLRQQEAQNQVPQATDVLRLQESLAEMYRREGKLDEAIKILVNLADEAITGTERFWNLCDTLAKAYQENGSPSNAQRYATLALNGRKQKLKTGHHATVGSMLLLAEVFDQRNETLEAARMRQEARKLRISQPSEFDNDMHRAVRMGDMTEVQSILNKLNEIEVKTILASKAFNWAVTYGQQGLASFLLGLEVDIVVNAPDETGTTPLNSAATSCCERMVRLLLENGAEPNTGDRQSWTALHQCASQQDRASGLRIARMLLQHNAQIDATTTAKDTALHLAARSGNNAMVCLLLDHDANINAQDIAGRTPLHIAIDNGWPATVRLLLDRNADTSVRDHKDRDAFRAGKHAQRGARVIQEHLKNEVFTMRARRDSVRSAASNDSKKSRFSLRRSCRS